MERVDKLMDTGLQIIQDDDYFSFGIDAIMLSMFANIKNYEKIIDLGTGVGVIPLMLSTRRIGLKITALEIQKEVASIACRNVELNSLQQVITVINGDLKDSKTIFGYECYDSVVCNPPYMPLGVGAVSKIDSYAIARHEVHCNIEDVVKACKSLVKYGGKVNLVYKASRLDELISLLLSHNLRPKRLQLVQSNKSSEPHIFMIEAVKGAKATLKILPTLNIYNGKDYSNQLKKLCFKEY